MGNVQINVNSALMSSHPVRKLKNELMIGFRFQRRRSGSSPAEGAPTLNGGSVDSGKQVRIVRSGHEPSDRVVGETVCKHKYSSYCVSDVEPASAGGGGGDCGPGGDARR